MASLICECEVKRYNAFVRFKPRRTFEVVHHSTKYWLVSIFAVFLGSNCVAMIVWLADWFGPRALVHHNLIWHFGTVAMLMVPSLLGLQFQRFWIPNIAVGLLCAPIFDGVFAIIWISLLMLNAAGASFFVGLLHRFSNKQQNS